MKNNLLKIQETLGLKTSATPARLSRADTFRKARNGIKAARSSKDPILEGMFLRRAIGLASSLKEIWILWHDVPDFVEENEILLRRAADLCSSVKDCEDVWKRFGEEQRPLTYEYLMCRWVSFCGSADELKVMLVHCGDYAAVKYAAMMRAVEISKAQ